MDWETSFGGFVQGRLLVGVQLDLDDLLDALFSELHRDADKGIVKTVFSLQSGGARRDSLLVAPQIDSTIVTAEEDGRHSTRCRFSGS